MSSRPPSDPADPAVLLLGHGSHLNGRSSRPVRDLAARLRRADRGAEVRVGFWKEEPELGQALLLVESSEVVAVPVFTSVGYFTDRVVPRELGIDPPVTVAGGLRVRYTRPVGAHPRMAGVVRERAQAALEAAGGDPADTALVILGHGTERHPSSGDVVHRLVSDVAAETRYAEVRPCFLDEEPRMVPALEALETKRAVVVPFFISEGWHVGTTIPRDLGLEEGRAQLGGTEIVYTEPVGTHPTMIGVVEALVDEALSGPEEEASSRSPRWTGRVATHDGGPLRAPGTSVAARARRAFLGWIDGGGPEGRTFLQTHVRPTGSGRYRVVHTEDRAREPGHLQRSSEPATARRIAARTEDGAHRPLRTAPTLRSGWLLEDLSGADLWEAYVHLYAAAPVHWYLERSGELRTTSYRQTAGRQTGLYARIGELSDEAVERAKSDCCAPRRCLRRVRWPLEGVEAATGASPTPPHPDAPESAGTEAPCPAPCSLLLTRARALLDRKG